MTAASLLISELRSSLAEESARMARDFTATGDGRAAVAQRTQVIEDILRRLWREDLSSSHEPSSDEPGSDKPSSNKPSSDKPGSDEAGERGFALVATGGFG